MEVGKALTRAVGRRAFTILQLLLVLVVISLLAATTIRCYFTQAEVTLENAAILLARDVRAAQHRSIFLGEPTHFTFPPEGNGYFVTDAAGNLARNPQTDQVFERRYPADGVFHGVAIVAVRAGEDRTLVIDDRGQPVEDMEVTLAYRESRRTVVLERGGGIVIGGSTSGWVDGE
jgi:type II secretory pathway pseudopilin PulG